MKRTYTKQALDNIGEKIKVAGWVDTVRSHGKIVFIDLRDFEGVLQIVVGPDQKEAYELAKKVRPEWVIEAKGKVSERPEKMVNKDLETGKVEIAVEKIEVLSEAETPPFSVEGEGYEISEEKRMTYRYLDLRRKRMKDNIVVRNNTIQFMRNYLVEKGFIEIETPILTKSTPEGSRDFVVPSRLQPGKFYALPQSPQQYKQLLQVAGFEKYFQVARCLRDEDPRADRQAEHTQLDIEMSFVEQEDIMSLIEKLFIKTVKEIFPEKRIQETPFPRITYKEAMDKYGTDRPDLRKDKEDPNLLAFTWVFDFPFFEKNDKGGWTFTHNPFSAPKKEFLKDLMEKKNIENILASQYDIVMNGWELGGGSIRNHKPEALKTVFEIMGYKKEEIEEKFGHMIKAFSYGAPPHGGIASGLDRFIALMRNEKSIREVIAFPKTGDNRALMTEAPSEISEEQLKELNIKTVKPKKK